MNVIKTYFNLQTAHVALSTTVQAFKIYFMCIFSCNYVIMHLRAIQCITQSKKTFVTKNIWQFCKVSKPLIMIQ